MEYVKFPLLFIMQRLYAGMDIVQITNHFIPSPYVTKRDATVSNGYLDFVFKNNNNTQ